MVDIQPKNTDTIRVNRVREKTSAALDIGPVGAFALNFKTNDTTRFTLGASDGHLVPGADNTYNLGSTSIALANVFTRKVGTGSSVALDILTNNLTRLTLSSGGDLSTDATNGGHITMNAAGKGLYILSGAALDAAITTVSPTNRTVQYIGSNVSSGTNLCMIANGASVNPNGLYCFKTRATTWAPSTIVGSGDSIFEFVGWAADGSAYQLSSCLRFKLGGTPGSGAMPGAIEFLTSAVGAATLRSRWIMGAAGDLTGDATYGGDVVLNCVGKGLKLKEGSNARMGVATLVGGTVTVANTSVTANTRVFYNRTTTGGTVGHLSSTQIASTSFTINSSSGTDTSTISWILVEPS